MHVELVPYSDSWPAAFNAARQRIALEAAGVCTAIEHIGSTAIPGMPAKPIIDLQAGIESFDHLPQLTPVLEALGLKGNPQIRQDHVPFEAAEYFDAEWEKRFFAGNIDGQRFHVHVRIRGAPNWQFALRFRDLLRKRPEIATAYRQLKERMAQAKISVGDYCSIKDPFCDLIYLMVQ